MRSFHELSSLLPNESIIVFGLIDWKNFATRQLKLRLNKQNPRRRVTGILDIPSPRKWTTARKAWLMLSASLRERFSSMPPGLYICVAATSSCQNDELLCWISVGFRIKNKLCFAIY